MTNTSLTDNWQVLMDAAYKKWEGKDWTYARFLVEIERKERIAVLLGNLNYQVENGGFRQWVDNGYALNAREIIAILMTIGGPGSIKVAEMVKQIAKHVDLTKTKVGWSDYWKRYTNRFGESSDEPTEGEKLAETLDNPFYDLQPEWHAEVAFFFNSI